MSFIVPSPVITLQIVNLGRQRLQICIMPSNFNFMLIVLFDRFDVVYNAIINRQWVVWILHVPPLDLGWPIFIHKPIKRASEVLVSLFWTPCCSKNFVWKV